MSHFELHVHSICYDQRKDTSFPIEKKFLILIGDVSEKFILAYRAYIYIFFVIKLVLPRYFIKISSTLGLS